MLHDIMSCIHSFGSSYICCVCSYKLVCRVSFFLEGFQNLIAARPDGPSEKLAPFELFPLSLCLLRPFLAENLYFSIIACLFN